MTETIYSLFEQTVECHKNEIAIIENSKKLTFGQLSNMVDILASTFPKDVSSVGIVMGHKAELITGILAVLKCGAKYVPVEPKFPTGRIHYMMKEANVDFILTEKEYESKLEGFRIRLLECENCGLNIPAVAYHMAENPNLPAYILYTSGTTGTPKGVCVTNRNVCHYVRAFAHEFHPSVGDRMLQYSVCTFDIFVEEIFGSLLNGAALVIPTEDDMADIHSLMSFVQRHHVTILSGFPYLLAEMNHLNEIPASLRLLISGGDVLRDVYIDHLLEQVEVYNTYGPSETTVCASYYRCNDGIILPDGTYPIGKAVKGTQIRILDQDGRELKHGETGEICIYGDGVSLGYIGEHDEENKAFVFLENNSMMYQSGDLGYVLPSGDIAFLHRKDTQIMIYGKRVEVSEVEARLYQCRGVQQALVRAYTDEAGLSYMIAYVVFTELGGKVSSLREELADNLTSYMIPEFIVKMPEIPLNMNGKPDISRLPIVMKEGAFS